MNALPDIGMEEEIEIVSEPTKTWIIDKDSGRIAGIDEGIKAMMQAVEIILNTQRFKWQIYTANFGTELEDLPGNDRAYIEAEILRRVEDALSVDDRIESVLDFAFSECEPGGLLCHFNVSTIFGTFTSEVILE